MAKNPAVLYAFYLSSCSWRVRAGLKWKQVPFEERAVDIVKQKHQLSEDYRTVNPSQKVPALVIDGETLVESMAILQYLEDTRPDPSLMPTTPLLKARMREVCETIVSGIQPLQNVGLRPRFASEQDFQQFSQYHAQRGLQTLEELLRRTAGRFCIGDQLTMADLCLVPQVYNAITRLKLDIGKYRTVSKLYECLLKEKVFEETHPLASKR